MIKKTMPDIVEENLHYRIRRLEYQAICARSREEKLRADLAHARRLLAKYEIEWEEENLEDTVL